MIPEVVAPRALADYFEVMTRAVFQAGVSWKQIAQPWEAYRAAFSDFDPARRYPVIDDMYPGPQLIRTPKSFCVSPAASYETWPGAWIDRPLPLR